MACGVWVGAEGAGLARDGGFNPLVPPIPWQDNMQEPVRPVTLFSALESQ